MPAAVVWFAREHEADVVAWSDHMNGDWRTVAAQSKSMEGAVLKRRGDDGEWHTIATIGARP